MIKIVTNVLGTFAIKNNRIIKSILFPREPKEIAERLLSSETGVCEEEMQLVKELISTGTKQLIVSNPSRFHGKGFDAEFIEDTDYTDPYKIAQEIGVDKKEAHNLITAANIELTKKKLRVLERDQILIQAVNSMDDIEEVSNRLMERLREWYSLHFPELDGLLKNHVLYANYVAGNKEIIGEDLMETITRLKEESMGMEFSALDLAETRKLAESITKLESFKADTEKYIEELMKDVAPNISALAGPTLGARLIAVAGGLEKLSKMPASTIQILGAEESFYRFKKTGKLPPKHGVIFQLPEIRGAARHLRGKISRTFASKMAIAAKTDYFKGEFIGEKLRRNFIESVERMRKQPQKKQETEENQDRKEFQSDQKFKAKKQGKGFRGGKRRGRR